MGDLEWGEQGGLNREERKPNHSAARTFGLFTLGFSITALLTFLFVSIDGPLAALAVGLGPPILTLIAIGAVVTLIRDMAGSFGLRQALSPTADEDSRNAVIPTVGKERELLSALRDSGGGITPVEAAIETSLTVREADAMLSELAGAGHLALESKNGALFYSLPGRSGPELENGN